MIPLAASYHPVTPTQHAIIFLLYVSLPGVNLFPVAYAIVAKWWKRRIGRAIMVSKVGFIGLADASAIFHIHGDTAYPFHDQLLLASYGLMTVGIYLYFWALWKEHLQPWLHGDTPHPSHVLD